MSEPVVLNDAELDEIVARIHNLADGADAVGVTASQVRGLVHNVRMARSSTGQPDDFEIVTMYSGSANRAAKSSDGDPRHNRIVAINTSGEECELYRGAEFDEARYAELRER